MASERFCGESPDVWVAYRQAICQARPALPMNTRHFHHHDLRTAIDRLGAPVFVRLGLANAAVSAAFATVDGQTRHRNLEDKAAVLFSRLSRSGAFVPASRAVPAARACLEHFLAVNGWRLHSSADEQELNSLLERVAAGHVHEALAAWLRPRLESTSSISAA